VVLGEQMPSSAAMFGTGKSHEQRYVVHFRARGISPLAKVVSFADGVAMVRSGRTG
jgi:hypothetical protein